MGTRADRRWWLLAVAAVVACLALASLAGLRTVSPPVAETAPRVEPPPMDARPIQQVPGVRPEGFADPPPGSGMSRYTEQALSWRTCAEGIECATALTPLDYRDADAQAITLVLARKPASATPRLGSLFINPGGPGGSGVEYVLSFESKGLEQYDIVGWDPRGVARSTPVTCMTGEELDAYLAREGSPDSAPEQQELLVSERAFGRSCLEKSGPLLTHVSTTETVRDLDLLRGLVGDERLNYFGSSYGTRIGSLYAEMFAANVGRMVLDGAVNITDDRSVSQKEGFDRALGQFAVWCAQQGCKLGTTKEEVLRAVTDLWQRLDQEPIDGGRRPLTQQGAVTGVSQVLYLSEKGWPYLRQGLEAAIDGDGRILQVFADQYHDRDRSGEYGQNNFSFPAVRCLDSEDVSATKALAESKREDAKAPTYGPASGPDLVCPMWPVAPAPKQPKIDGAGARPIVVIGTTGDPATPYEYAVSMAEQLTSGVLVTLEGVGHLAYGQSRCVQAHVVDYLVDDEVPEDGVRC